MRFLRPEILRKLSQPLRSLKTEVTALAIRCAEAAAANRRSEETLQLQRQVNRAISLLPDGEAGEVVELFEEAFKLFESAHISYCHQAVEKALNESGANTIRLEISLPRIAPSRNIEAVMRKVRGKRNDPTQSV